MRIFDQYLFDNNRYDNSVLALHGAAVEYGGRAYLFLASSTAGKTTLCAYLLSLGFGFVTEDCILVDRSTFDIHPCTAYREIFRSAGYFSSSERYRKMPFFR